VTDLALERYLVDELDATADRDHIIGCLHCRTKLAAKRREGDTYMRSSEAKHLGQLLEATERVLAPRRKSRAWIAVAAALAAVAIVAALAWPRGPAGGEAEVLGVERAWMAAYVHNDAEALDAILAPDYKLTDDTGNVVTKADDVSRARARTLHYDLYDTSDLHVRVWGDTAVVTGRAEVRGTSSDRPFATRFAFTDTLSRIDGRWRAVAAHVSHLR
jgi:ketosteroid isomerase-like protein